MRGERRDPARARELYDLAGGMIHVLSAVVLLFLLAARPFWVDGASMAPTLVDRELMLVRSAGYTPQPGDIVVLSQPGFRDEPIVKRVIALGGQTVEIDYAASRVLVDGRVLEEPYLRGSMTRQSAHTLTKLTVPPGQLFVMGDNRNHSDDSRNPACGTVDQRRVLGQAVAVMFPLGSARPLA